MVGTSSSTSSSIISSSNEGGYTIFLSFPYNKNRTLGVLNDQGEIANPNSL